MDLTALSSADLIAALDVEWGAGNRALAKMLAYLGEVERRGLHVEMACSSMFAFLERRFGLTGGSAYRRLTAARLVRRFPSILPRVERGEIHLEALCALREVLTEDNVEEVLAKAAKKTLRDIEPLVASLAPKPDVKPSLRKLPERSLPSISAAPQAQTAPPAPSPPPPARPESPRPRVEQLSQARHKVQLTVSSETRAKIERARNLMAHRNPSGDLETLFDQAMDALIEKLEKERLGKTSRPQKKRRPSQPGHVPAEVRRAVFERDGERCTYVDAEGHRCDAKELLELDHITPRAHRGGDNPTNLRVVCRAHNRRYAEAVFGKAYVAARIAERRRAPNDAHPK